jgi:hypothetical protein
MIQLGAGDALLIEQHRRYRVDWIDENRPLVWLVRHFSRTGRKVD